jgi:hypothetical protein
VLDDVRFPVHRLILQIGGIQGGFAIGVLGKSSAQLGEDGGGAIGGHDLRQKLMLIFRIAHKQRLQLVGGIVTDRTGALHHELGLLQDLGAGVLVEEVVSNEGHDQETQRCQCHKDEVEFEQ